MKERKRDVLWVIEKVLVVTGEVLGSTEHDLSALVEVLWILLGVIEEEETQGDSSNE